MAFLALRGRAIRKAYNSSKFFVATLPEALVEGGDDAHPKGVTGPLLNSFLVKSSITFIIS